MGHTVGDLLLNAFSKTLLKCVRPLDTVARLGGDEFAVLLEDISGEGNAMYVASRIKEELKKAIPVPGSEVFISGSMGIALSSGDYDNPEQVIRDADTAMYQSRPIAVRTLRSSSRRCTTAQWNACGWKQT